MLVFWSTGLVDKLAEPTTCDGRHQCPDHKWLWFWLSQLVIRHSASGLETRLPGFQSWLTSGEADPEDMGGSEEKESATSSTRRPMIRQALLYEAFLGHLLALSGNPDFQKSGNPEIRILGKKQKSTGVGMLAH